MVNAVILHSPGDEGTARMIAGAWRGGRATLCKMSPERQRVAIGAHSVMIGLWSAKSGADDSGRCLAAALGAAPERSLLVVWDGRPPLAQAAADGVSVIVAPEAAGALMERLHTAAERLEDGRSALGTERSVDGTAKTIGVVLGLCLGALAVAALTGAIPLR
ncbi:MAG: hypothetical protein JNJ73_16125 [Hyphomonadaceae bacterium]|nr:hypothetical protein [Hyphomonadaceae bacterium]